LKDALERREKQCGMTTEAFLQTIEAGCPSEPHPPQSWKQEYHELRYWQKMLNEYEEALENLK
jgi:hypothetical protein